MTDVGDVGVLLKKMASQRLGTTVFGERTFYRFNYLSGCEVAPSQRVSLLLFSIQTREMKTGKRITHDNDTACKRAVIFSLILFNRGNGNLLTLNDIIVCCIL